MSQATYDAIHRRLFEELAKDIEVAKKRRYCSRDEIAVAMHALTPAGFRRMQPVLDEVGVTGAEVAAWVGAHPELTRGSSPEESTHELQIAALRETMEASLPRDDETACVSSAPRCEAAFLRFQQLTLDALEPKARDDKRAELTRAMGHFLNACAGGAMAGDFTCVLEAATPSEFEACTFFRGLPVGWFGPG